MSQSTKLPYQFPTLAGVPLAADRLSEHRFWANGFWLFLHAAAYWLLDTLRLLKVGGRVRLSLASSHPAESLWQHLATRSRIPMNNRALDNSA